MRLTAALATTALAATTLTLAATASPAVAADACSMTLDPDRRSVYKLTNGGEALGFGQVVVQATQAQYHLYCIRFQTGGRTVTHSFSQSSKVRENGACTTDLGGLGSGVYTTGGYTSSMQVPDRECTYRSYSIRSDGRWWTASFMRYNA